MYPALNGQNNLFLRVHCYLQWLHLPECGTHKSFDNDGDPLSDGEYEDIDLAGDEPPSFNHGYMSDDGNIASDTTSDTVGGGGEKQEEGHMMVGQQLLFHTPLSDAARSRAVLTSSPTVTKASDQKENSFDISSVLLQVQQLMQSKNYVMKYKYDDLFPTRTRGNMKPGAKHTSKSIEDTTTKRLNARSDLQRRLVSICFCDSASCK